MIMMFHLFLSSRQNLEDREVTFFVVNLILWQMPFAKISIWLSFMRSRGCGKRFSVDVILFSLSLTLSDVNIMASEPHTRFSSRTTHNYEKGGYSRSRHQFLNAARY